MIGCCAEVPAGTRIPNNNRISNPVWLLGRLTLFAIGEPPARFYPNQNVLAESGDHNKGFPMHAPDAERS